MLFPPRELDTCKLTLPHMIENMVPIIAQGQTVRRRRRVASPAIGFIWSANHPEIAPHSTSTMSCSGAGWFRDGVKFDDTHAHVRTGSTGSWVYRVLFSSLQECPLLGLASPRSHASSHVCCLAIQIFTVGLRYISLSPSFYALS